MRLFLLKELVLPRMIGINTFRTRVYRKTHRQQESEDRSEDKNRSTHEQHENNGIETLFSCSS